MKGINEETAIPNRKLAKLVMPRFSVDLGKSYLELASERIRGLSSYPILQKDFEPETFSESRFQDMDDDGFTREYVQRHYSDFHKCWDVLQRNSPYILGQVQKLESTIYPEYASKILSGDWENNSMANSIDYSIDVPIPKIRVKKLDKSKMPDSEYMPIRWNGNYAMGHAIIRELELRWNNPLFEGAFREYTNSLLKEIGEDKNELASKWINTWARGAKLDVDLKHKYRPYSANFYLHVGSAFS